MANPFEKDWTKPEGHELHEVGISIMDDFHWHVGSLSRPPSGGLASGFEYWRFHQQDSGEDVPPTIHSPTMEQEAHMKQLGVTDVEVLRCVCEKHGIHMSNVGQGEGASVKELRDEGLEILEQRFIQETQLRFLELIQNMVDQRRDPSHMIIDGNHDWMKP